MTNSTKTPEFLNVPAVASAHYKENFIRQVVCELRFPTLFDLDSSKPPIALAQALRKEYPNYQTVNNVNLSTGGLPKTNNSHIFRSKQNKWATSISPSSLTLETTAYSSFEEFHSRINDIVKAASKVIDTDFFTRVGLRYINSIPYPDDDDIREWINPDLVQILASGIYGELQEHSQRVAGLASFGGGYLFQHGLGEIINNETSYTLDFDFFKEDVPVTESMSLLKVMHDQEFSMFTWALGKKAKAQLSDSKVKNKD